MGECREGMTGLGRGKARPASGAMHGAVKWPCTSEQQSTHASGPYMSREESMGEDRRERGEGGGEK